jgi:formylglycine-generating enzyme required for sulfatase activity
VTSSLDAGTAMQSCLPGGDGLTNCGAAQESCCTSLAVPGGTFFRTYTNNGSGPVGEADPATISAFRLDKYDVTTGRFRRFVAAWNGGWRPAAGSGKHASLSGGRGLVDEATTSGFEPGWAAADEAHVVPTNDQLDCQPGRSAWTPSPGAHETLPMNCVNWWEAYAFCIWDGGFLPTQAEWEYAAAGGSEQRQYSWGSTPPGTSNQYAIYDCHYGPFDAGASLPLDACAYQATLANVAPVGSAPLGAGAFGQLDLIGNVLTWALDTRPSPFGPSFSNPCVDCAYLPDASGTTERTISGGIFGANGLPLSPWVRIYVSAPTTYDDLGFRCARAPE